MPIEYTCYGSPPSAFGDLIPILPTDELVTDEVAIGASNQVSAAFPSGTVMVVVIPDAAVRIAIGLNPVASNVAPKTRLLAANREYIFAAKAGMKLAGIQGA